MELSFSKMHGLGNDFVVIDAIRQNVKLSTEQIQFLADRRFGVGCDQVLLVESANQNDADFRYRSLMPMAVKLINAVTVCAVLPVLSSNGG